MNVKDFDLLLCMLRVLVLIASFWIMIEMGQLPFRVYCASGQSCTLFTSQLFSCQKESKGRHKEWFSCLPVQSVVFCFFLIKIITLTSENDSWKLNPSLAFFSTWLWLPFFQPCGLFSVYRLSQFLLSVSEGNLQISWMPSAGFAWKIFHVTVRDFTSTLSPG